MRGFSRRNSSRARVPAFFTPTIIADGKAFRSSSASATGATVNHTVSNIWWNSHSSMPRNGFSSSVDARWRAWPALKTSTNESWQLRSYFKRSTWVCNPIKRSAVGVFPAFCNNYLFTKNIYINLSVWKKKKSKRLLRMNLLSLSPRVQ